MWLALMTSHALRNICDRMHTWVQGKMDTLDVPIGGRPETVERQLKEVQVGELLSSKRITIKCLCVCMHTHTHLHSHRHKMLFPTPKISLPSHLPNRLCTFCLPVCLSVHPSVCLSECLSMCLSVHPTCVVHAQCYHCCTLPMFFLPWKAKLSRTTYHHSMLHLRSQDK